MFLILPTVTVLSLKELHPSKCLVQYLPLTDFQLIFVECINNVLMSATSPSRYVKERGKVSACVYVFNY